jgi:hypothetical protein
MSARLESLLDAGYTFCTACYASGKGTVEDLLDVRETEIIDGERYCRQHADAIAAQQEAAVQP